MGERFIEVIGLRGGVGDCSVRAEATGYPRDCELRRHSTEVHGCRSEWSHIFVSHEFLDGSDIGSGGEQMCGEAVAKRVAAGWFLEVELAYGEANGVLVG